MTASETQPVLEVPARVIPVPASVSPEAQAFLARGPLQVPENPALDDIEGWRQRVAAIDQMMRARLAESGATTPVGFQVGEISLGGLTVYAVTLPGLPSGDRRIYLDPPGGAFIVRGGGLRRATRITAAAQLRMRAWGPPYRLPPHP